jgi:hypothetical protein
MTTDIKQERAGQDLLAGITIMIIRGIRTDIVIQGYLVAGIITINKDTKQ